MMLILAALAVAAAPPAPGAVPPASPAGPASSAAAPQDAASSLDGLQQIYQQSCANREYGAFDDLCDQLSKQIRQARAQANRDARAAARKSRSTPPKPTLAPASASAKPPAG